jgi:hypothetical protein
MCVRRPGPAQPRRLMALHAKKGGGGGGAAASSAETDLDLVALEAEEDAVSMASMVTCRAA